MKPLNEYFAAIPFTWNQKGALTVPIHRIQSDSRKVERHDLFVAVSGSYADGHQFIREAVRKGAAAVVSERPDKWLDEQQIPHMIVSNSRRSFSELTARFYGYPAKKLKLIGITGTNGKTTSAFLLQHLLNGAKRAGLIGTIHHDDGVQLYPAGNTTPGAEELQALLARMAACGLDYCVMEVSSHALDQDRVWGIPFLGAMFTNLTQDHLDYHHDFETYYQSKRKLFSAEPLPQHSLVNRDDAYGRRLIGELDRSSVKSYGFSEGADYRAHSFEQSAGEIRFQLTCSAGSFGVRAPLLLRHNALNLLGALGVLFELGWEAEDVLPRLQSFAGVPGRMQRIRGVQSFDIFIDYAHTPDALEQILSQARTLVSGRIISVFGCGGDRDPLKRPLMGRAAQQYSDTVVLTSDNPRSEPPGEILKQIQTGFDRTLSKKEIFVIEDRKEAIRFALGRARAKDGVFIFGKGHEDYQIIGDRKIHFRDEEIVQEYLEKCLHLEKPQEFAVGH